MGTYVQPLRHPLCREELRRAGQPYPKSTCEECGSVLRPDFRCPHEPATAAVVVPPDAPAMISFDRLIAVCAFRYAVGRMTYTPWSAAGSSATGRRASASARMRG